MVVNSGPPVYDGQLPVYPLSFYMKVGGMALVDKDYPFFSWDRYLNISVHVLVDLKPARVSGGRVY